MGSVKGKVFSVFQSFLGCISVASSDIYALGANFTQQLWAFNNLLTNIWWLSRKVRCRWSQLFLASLTLFLILLAWKIVMEDIPDRAFWRKVLHWPIICGRELTWVRENQAITLRKLFKPYASTPQFHTDPLISKHQFHFWTTPFQPRKSLSSTPKTSQFDTQTPSVKHNPSVPH